MSASARNVKAFGTNMTKLSLVMLYHERVRNAISGVTMFWPRTHTTRIKASARRTKIMKEAILNVRAIYGDSDIYLLDDPLSAVDANVGKVLFEK